MKPNLTASPVRWHIANAAMEKIRLAPVALTISILIPLAALVLQWVLWPWIKPFVWFLFFPAVFLSARIGGLRGGLPATVFSIFLVWYFFIPPQLSWHIENPNNYWSMVLFLVMGWLFSDVQERLIQARKRIAEILEETQAAIKANVETILRINGNAMPIQTQDGRIAPVNPQAERMMASIADISTPGQTKMMLQKTADVHAARMAALQKSEERFRLLVEGVRDCALYMLDPAGRVTTWNSGAEHIKGYRAEEIVGQDFACFYLPEDIECGRPQEDLRKAATEGRYEAEGWRVRKDGSHFWADVRITALHDEAGALRGFAKVTRDVTERRKAEIDIRTLNATLEQKVARRTADLLAANQELEAFSYSVSHDLRAPLRAIDGFSRMLQEDYAEHLDEAGCDCTARIRRSAQHMGALIDDMINLSRISRVDLTRMDVDLSALAREIVDRLQARVPERQIEFDIADAITAHGDQRLLRIALVNLLDNAWKFTAGRSPARIEFGQKQVDGETAYYVRDNGVGFDMAYVGKLFGAFQRLHNVHEFPGTGIGLATVQRVINKHSGRVWAEAEPDKGATFYFTL